MAQTAKPKELCIKCGKKPPVFKGELWCGKCYNKLLKKPKIKQYSYEKDIRTNT